MNSNFNPLWTLSILIFLLTLQTYAGESKKKKTSTQAQEVELEAIQEKYWVGGDKKSMGVVQNRKFTKAGRFQFGLLAGKIYSDPFLDMNNVGGIFGYHFNEYWSLSLVGWRTFTSASKALETFEENRGATANTNPPYGYLGLETNASFLYGKLSLAGLKIIYYDLHLSGGTGVTFTETGNYLTPSLGLGQRFYLTDHFSLRLDYRLMYYRETIIEKEVPTRRGQSVGERDNWSNVITIGIDFMF